MAARANEALNQYDASISSAAVIDISSTDATLNRITRGLYVGVAGDVVVQFAGDNGNITLTGLAAGVWHPVQIQKVVKTGTTATNIVVGY